MRYQKKALAVLGAAALLSSMLLPSIVAAQDRPEEAEQLRSLDIMLMVTALRCRHGSDDFQTDYNRFAARHLETMNGAARELQAHYARGREGAQARRALDSISTGIANRYGQGHPWLECADLGRVARDLAQVDSRQTLLLAAADLLQERLPQRDGLLARYGD